MSKFKIGDKVKMSQAGIDKWGLDSNINPKDTVGEVYKFITDIWAAEFTVRVKWPKGANLYRDVDLELVPASPVKTTTVTTTKTEIVPGSYGRVYVTDDGFIGLVTTKSKSQLLESIATLQQIADAMEDDQ